LLKIV